jgi:hypothetical protein
VHDHMNRDELSIFCHVGTITTAEQALSPPRKATFGKTAGPDRALVRASGLGHCEGLGGRGQTQGIIRVALSRSCFGGDIGTYAWEGLKMHAPSRFPAR